MKLTKKAQKVLDEVNNGKDITTQYFSKCRNKWIDFKNQPTPDEEIMMMKKFNYQIRILN